MAAAATFTPKLFVWLRIAWISFVDLQHRIARMYLASSVNNEKAELLTTFNPSESKEMDNRRIPSVCFGMNRE
jgi:hypothetical protein